MVKKKKPEELPEPTLDEAVEPAPQILPDAAPLTLGTEKAEKVADTVTKPEPLLTVTVAEDFKDGALTARFAKYGYPTLWKKGETRRIPMDLFVRCKRSGARFVL